MKNLFLSIALLLGTAAHAAEELPAGTVLTYSLVNGFSSLDEYTIKRTIIKSDAAADTVEVKIEVFLKDELKSSATKTGSYKVFYLGGAEKVKNCDTKNTRDQLLDVKSTVGDFKSCVNFFELEVGGMGNIYNAYTYHADVPGGILYEMVQDPRSEKYVFMHKLLSIETPKVEKVDQVAVPKCKNP